MFARQRDVHRFIGCADGARRQGVERDEATRSSEPEVVLEHFFEINR
jgi:hypothetical protein